MKLGTGKANRQKKALWSLGAMLGAVLAMTTVSEALQTPVPAPPRAQAPEFAKAALARTTVHWVLVSIPDRKLALFENGRVVRLYRVAVGKTSTPSPAGEFKIVNRVTNPTYYHKGQVIGAGKGKPGGHTLGGTERKGLRNPRHQPAELDRQSGIDGMHSHGQAGSRGTLRDHRRRRHSPDSRGTRRANRGSLRNGNWIWSRNRDRDDRASRDRKELGQRAIGPTFLVETRLASSQSSQGYGGRSWKRCCKVW